VATSLPHSPSQTQQMDVEQELSPLIGGKTVADDFNPDFKPIPKNSWFFAGEILQLENSSNIFSIFFVPILRRILPLNSLWETIA
jgi:hypothetical protein